jgi:hypothetical protein
MTKQFLAPPKVHRNQRVKFLLDGEEIFHQIHDLLNLSRKAYFAFWEADPDVCLEYNSYVTGQGVEPLKLINVLLKNPDNPHLRTHMLHWYPALFAGTFLPDQKAIKQHADHWLKLGKAHANKLTATYRYHANSAGSWHQKFIVFEVPLVDFGTTKIKNVKNVDQLPFCYVGMVIGTNLAQSYVDSELHPYEASVAKNINGGSTEGYYGWHDAGVVVLGDFGIELMRYYAKFDKSAKVDESAAPYQQSMVDDLARNLDHGQRYQYGGTYEPVQSVELLCNDYEADSYGSGTHKQHWWRRQITDAYLHEIKNAAEHIYIESFYLTDREIVKALRGKLLTGCTVRVLTCGTDKPSKWTSPRNLEINTWANDLLGKGVQKQVQKLEKQLKPDPVTKKKPPVGQGYFEMIWPRIKCQEVRPIFVHSKVLITDWKTMIIGTCNFNEGSTRVDGEIAVRIRDQAFCTTAYQRDEQHLQAHTYLEDLTSHGSILKLDPGLLWWRL